MFKHGMKNYFVEESVTRKFDKFSCLCDREVPHQTVVTEVPVSSPSADKDLYFCFAYFTFVLLLLCYYLFGLKPLFFIKCCHFFATPFNFVYMYL